MPLHIDYRPRTFEEFRGNKALIESLTSVLSREDKPHAFLFAGPSGTGKTTLGRLMKDFLGCADADFYEMNAANTRGIDSVRDVFIQCKYAPMGGKVRVYLWDECHQLTGAAAEATLKVLEDTPKHVFFILCTTEPDKLIPTIRNRCSTYTVASLSRSEVIGLIEWVLESEGIKGFWDDVILEIVRVAEGCPRKALVCLDQVIDLTSKETALAAIAAATVDQAGVVDLCRLLLKAGGSGQNKTWEEVTKLLRGIDSEPESVRRGVLGYMTSVLLNKPHPSAARIIRCFSENYFNTGKAGLIQSCYNHVFG